MTLIACFIFSHLMQQDATLKTFHVANIARFGLQQCDIADVDGIFQLELLVGLYVAGFQQISGIMFSYMFLEWQFPGNFPQPEL